jgi:glycine/D-amino acid oxidase-like deaminating enzyme
MSRTHRPEFDAIVVGSGIIGSAVARELALRSLRVLVLDGGDSGRSATHSGMGHLITLEDDPAQFALIQRSRELWGGLASGLPTAVEWSPCGTMWLADEPVQVALLEAKHARLTELGVASELLTDQATRRREPSLSDVVQGGLRVPGDAVLYQPAAARHLLETAMRSGTTVRDQATVRQVRSGEVQLADGGCIGAKLIVIAAGLASPSLLEGAPAGLRIEARKGHLLITSRGPARCHHHLVEIGYAGSARANGRESVAFNLQPRPGGQLLLGSSRQLGVTNSGVETSIVRKMHERARRFMPSLSEVPILRAWTGMRPSTADKLPFLGAVPGQAGVYMAAGHEGLGVTTSLASAELVADIALGAPPRLDARPYRLDRLDNSSHLSGARAHG